MLRTKLFFSILIFSILFSVTSIIKTQTRIIEKKITKIQDRIVILERDLHETELDFEYLSSPSSLSKKIKDFALIDYEPLEFSKIYFNFSDFTNNSEKISFKTTNDNKK